MEYIDIGIVLSFLIITLLVGIGSSGKIRNLKDYALGGRNFTTGALVATIVATYASASGFFIDLNSTYTDGLFYIVAAVCMGIQLILTGYILVPRMGEFMGKTTVAEAMGSLYGKEVRIITAIAGTIGALGSIAVQFKAFGNVTAYFTGISAAESILISGAVVTLYSVLGGIRAVTTTDILQFFTFGFVIPLIGIIIWNKIYFGEEVIGHVLELDQFNPAELLNIDNPKFWPMISLMLYFLSPSLRPAVYQRILIGRDLRQVKKAFIISGILCIIILFAVSWIAFLILSVNDKLQPNELLGFIIDKYTYVGLKGLIIIGIIAMAMSTADSHMNVSSVLFANDICGPLKIGNTRQLFLSKWFSFVLGAGAIMLAFSQQDLLSIVLSVNSFYMPVVTVPLLATIMGFRSSKKSVLIAMAAGLSTVITWKFFGIKADPIFCGMMVNLVFLMGSHYLLKQKGGFVGIKDKISYNELVTQNNKTDVNIFKKYRNFNFIKYCKKNYPTNEISCSGLGIYFIVFTITTMYSTQSELLSQNRNIALAIYQLMMITGVLIAMYPIWPLNIRREFKETIVQVAWPVTIFYMLIVFNSFFILISNFDLLQFAFFSINLVITSILVGWRLATIMIVIGSSIAGVFYNSFFSDYTIDITVGSPGFICIYILMIVATILVVVIKPKEDQQKSVHAKAEYLSNENTNLTSIIDDYSTKIAVQEQEIKKLGKTAQLILNNVNHELRLPVGSVMNFSEILSEGLNKYSKEQLKILSDEIYNNSNRLSLMILNMLDLAMLDVKKIQLQKRNINLSELVEDRAHHCFIQYKDNKNLKFELDIQPEIFTKIDPNYMRQVIDNLVINAIKYSNQGTISIKLLIDNNLILFTITDQGIGIPRDEVYDIFEPFKVSSKTITPQEGRGVGLALCKSAIIAHGGEIKAESNGEVGAKFTFVLKL